MIESLDELVFAPEDTEEQIWAKLKDMIGVEQEQITASLSKMTVDKSNSIVNQFENIAPHNDYGKFLTTESDMAYFIENEASKPENWDLIDVSVNSDKNLVNFKFLNKAVDDGNSLAGFVWVSKTGKIKHTYAQNEL